MRRDPTQFRERFKQWKNGAKVYEAGLPKYEDGKYAKLSPIVPFKLKTEVIITPDKEYNVYLNTLPDNQRFTPNEKYDSYSYWKLNGKPKNFEEAYNKGMFTFDHSDKSYHANSIAYDDNTGIGYFMKPKDHSTIKYELDWFNKGLVTEEGGYQRPETFFEWRESQPFRNNHLLIDDPDRPNFYMYKPILSKQSLKLKLPKYEGGKSSWITNAANLLKNNTRSTFDIPYGSYGRWKNDSQQNMSVGQLLGKTILIAEKKAVSNFAHHNGGSGGINPFTAPFLIFGLGPSYHGFVQNRGTKDPYFSVKPKSGADVINLALYGDTKGFLRYKGDTIKINNIPFGDYNNTYYTKIIDKDTLKLSPRMKDFILDAVNNNTNNLSLDQTNYLEYNRKNGISTLPLYDAQHFTGQFLPNKMLLLDSHDGNLIYDSFIKTPYLVQEIPIKYLENDVDDKLIQNIIDMDMDNWHKDQREGKFIDFIKQHRH